MNTCKEIHEKLNELQRFEYPFDQKLLPKNGVYVFFEKGEVAHGGDRIVHIGTHRAQNGLVNRLGEIFENENKNRSILRKQIGGCILNRINDPYVKIWNKNTTRTKVKEELNGLINYEYEKQIEEKVTKYINENLSFVVIEENDESKRKSIKKELLSIISTCPECKQSSEWLGNFAVNDKVRRSGIWNDKFLYKKRETCYLNDILNL